jgi:hypothetical protein
MCLCVCSSCGDIPAAVAVGLQFCGECLLFSLGYAIRSLSNINLRTVMQADQRLKSKEVEHLKQQRRGSLKVEGDRLKV